MIVSYIGSSQHLDITKEYLVRVYMFVTKLNDERWKYGNPKIGTPRHADDADIPDREVRETGVEIRYFKPYARIWALPDKPGCRGARDQELWMREENRRRVYRIIANCIDISNDPKTLNILTDFDDKLWDNFSKKFLIFISSRIIYIKNNYILIN